MLGDDAPPETPSKDVHQPAAGAVRMTTRPLANLPHAAALEKRTFDYSQH